jgi:hypothetical protein
LQTFAIFLAISSLDSFQQRISYRTIVDTTGDAVRVGTTR